MRVDSYPKPGPAKTSGDDDPAEGDPPERAAILAAAREFNAGRYFEAHEALEESLDDVPDELWNLFIGLIQIAVGYHKVSQRLYAGGANMLRRGLAKTVPYDAREADLDLAALRARVSDDIQRLADGEWSSAAAATDPPRLRPLRSVS